MVSLSDFAHPPTAYTASFTATTATGEWEGAGPYTRTIAGSDHNLETIRHVQVIDGLTDQVVQVGVTIPTGANPDITLTSTTAFAGRVDIRS